MTVEEIVEKIKKSDNIFDKAKWLLLLKKEKGLRLYEISKKTGIKASYICHYFRLNNLPEIIIDGYYSKSVTPSHLFILSRLKTAKEIINTYEIILKNNLSVIETEYLIREILYGIKSKGNYLSHQDVKVFEDKFKSKNSKAKLKVIQSRVKGKLIVEFKSDLAETTPYLLRLLKGLVEDF